MARNFGEKPTREQMAERVEHTAFLLSRRLYKCDIKRLLKKRYGVRARACETYLARARALLVADSGKPKEEHAKDALRFWESIVAGKDATLKDRMDAQDHIESLVGVERIAPTQGIKGEFEVNVFERIGHYRAALLAERPGPGAAALRNGHGQPLDSPPANGTASGIPDPP